MKSKNYENFCHRYPDLFLKLIKLCFKYPKIEDASQTGSSKPFVTLTLRVKYMKLFYNSAWKLI